MPWLQAPCGCAAAWGRCLLLKAVGCGPERVRWLGLVRELIRLRVTRLKRLFFTRVWGRIQNISIITAVVFNHQKAGGWALDKSRSTHHPAHASAGQAPWACVQSMWLNPVCARSMCILPMAGSFPLPHTMWGVWQRRRTDTHKPDATRAPQVVGGVMEAAPRGGELLACSRAVSTWGRTGGASSARPRGGGKCGAADAEPLAGPRITRRTHGPPPVCSAPMRCRETRIQTCTRAGRARCPEQHC